MADRKNTEIALKYITLLQETYLDSVLSGRKPTLNLTSLEPDRRKHSKLARELINRSFIELIAPDSYYAYLICEPVLESLGTVEVDLCQMWKKRMERNAPAAEQREWIRIDRFDAGQKKAILRSSHFDFYTVSRDAYSQWSKFADTRGTLMADVTNPHEQYWDGPFDTISEALKLIRGQPTLILAVSSLAFRAFVSAELRSQKLAALYQANTLWGLVECGIVERHIVFDEHDKPLISRQFQVPSFPFFGSSQSSQSGPEAWESNLNTSIGQLEDQLAKLTQRLNTMRLIAQGIDRFGGWEKFRQSYSAKLSQHLESMQ